MTALPRGRLTWEVRRTISRNRRLCGYHVNWDVDVSGALVPRQAHRAQALADQYAWRRLGSRRGTVPKAFALSFVAKEACETTVF